MYPKYLKFNKIIGVEIISAMSTSFMLQGSEKVVKKFLFGWSEVG